MHTSHLTYGLFLGGVLFAILTQVINFCLATPRSRGRAIVMVIGVAGICLAAAAGYRASIDWSALPTSFDGLRPGQLWDDGGVPAIVEKQK